MKPTTETAPTGIRLRRELLNHPGRLAAAGVLALGATVATLALPLLVKSIIEALTSHGSPLDPVMWLGVAAIGGAIAQAGSGILLARVGEDMTFRIRSRIMSHALRLPLSTVRTQGTGDLTARVTSDALLLRQVLDVGAQVPFAVLTVTFTLVVMFLLDWVLTAVTVAALVLVTIVLSIILRRVKASVMGQQVAIGKIAQRFTATLEALTTVKAYRAEPLASRALTDDADSLRSTSMTGARLQSLIPAVTSLGNQVALVAVILTGGWRVAGGSLDIAAFGAFLLYLLQTIPPATALTTSLGRIQAGVAARERCNELLAVPDEARSRAAVEAPDPLPGTPSVEFRDVGFTHAGAGVTTLHDVSLATPRVGLTAVVGPSGAGKTTMLSLIDQFMEPHSGRITVLGHDALTWPLDDLRARIAYVDQSFTLLEATVRENLELGLDGTADDARLASVLEAVGLTEDVASLPQGMDTLLGRETDLSGGQRQRMALARALLSNAEIVLLDEPTSQLDGLNERRFRDIIGTLATSRSVIVVAHRLSTVQHADHVIMMRDGAVVDAADHHTLSDRCGPYRELVASQTMADVPEARRGEPVAVG